MHNQEHICMACGHVGQPENIICGSFLGESALWIIAIIIAASSSWLLLFGPLAYSIYRISSKKQGCSLCKSTQIIPVDSPNGQALISANSPTASE